MWWLPNCPSHDNCENKDLVAGKLTFSQLMEFFSQVLRTTMIGFMGPFLLKKTYKTLFAARLHFFFTNIFKYIKYFKE
jgi:hypothetical protein